jgi:hypothetical protein
LSQEEHQVFHRLAVAVAVAVAVHRVYQGRVAQAG